MVRTKTITRKTTAYPCPIDKVLERKTTAYVSTRRVPPTALNRKKADVERQKQVIEQTEATDTIEHGGGNESEEEEDIKEETRKNTRISKKLKKQAFLQPSEFEKMGRATKKQQLTRRQKEIKESKYKRKGSNAWDEHIEPDNNVRNDDNPQESKNNAIQTEKIGRVTKKKKLTHKQKEIKEPKFAPKGSNPRDEHSEPDNDVRNDYNPQASKNNAIQTEVNSENNGAQIEYNPQAFEDNALQTEGNFEVAMENERLNQDVDANPIVKRKTRGRGPTKVKRLPSDPVSRIVVEFNSECEPIGAGSVKLSSYLGPLVRKHVPVTLNNWRLLSDKLKVVLWESIQARFKLEEEWQKIPIFHQMSCNWRSSKCRLVRKIVNAKTKEEMLQLKPDNVKSMKEWETFIELKTSSNFKTLSEKFKAIRRNQMTHTCSRRGMARLAEDLREQSADPSSVSRVQVWIKSRIRKNGEPVSMAVADTIEKIKKIDGESQYSSTINVEENTLSSGQDRSAQPKAVPKAMGRGMTLSKAISLHAKDKQVAQIQSRISEMEEMVQMLMKNQGEESCREESIPQMSKCDLLDWSGTDEIVAEGRVVSSDPNELVHKIPLGPNAVKILIDLSRKSDAFLWRPTPNLTYIGEAEDRVVAWPASRVVLHVVQNSKKEENASKTSNTDNKCKLYDWCGSEELVAEGRLYSSDPKQLVNDIPLGPSAMVVWVDDSKKKDAFLWRPTAGMTYVGEAIGSKVAWPESKVTIEKFDAAACSTPMVNAAACSTPMSVNYMPKNKCKLIDLCGTGEVVAEGRVSSTDPNALVHSVPLGRNAVKVWVDDAKVPNALLWRPSSELEYIEDAIGTTIAWPSANVITESSRN